MRERKRRLWHATPWDGEPGIWSAWRRLLYQFEGPSQLGDPNEPAYVPAPNPKCPVCNEPMKDHRVDRGGPGKPTHLKCPAPKTDEASAETPGADSNTVAPAETHE